MRISRLLFVAALATASACGARQPGHIDGGVLGRVVVYRNGVAFYERSARVENGTVTVRVPRERVDDFLKSLTVVDRRTQKPLMVTIPRQQSHEGQYLAMTLETPEVATADVLLTYVTESPAWKPSYRIVVGTDDKVMLEGWAIVDNMTSEDWRGVLVGVGASSALAFRYDLWSVRTVDRDLLARDDRFAIAPPTAVSPYELRGEEIALGAAPGVATSATLGRSFSGASSSENRYYVDGVNTGGESIQITERAPESAEERHAREAERDATLVRDVLARNKEIVVQANRVDRAQSQDVVNKLVDAGMPAHKIHVLARNDASDPPGVRTVMVDTGAVPASPETSPPRRDMGPDAPVGESHFMADRPMTVKAGSSAMVSMVRGETRGGVVYLYDPISTRGDTRYAFKAVRLENPTNETLEPGPVTVYGEGRFIGEGITEAVLPRAVVVVPFALDKQIVVEKAESETDRLARVVTVERGVMTAEVQHRRDATFTVKSRSANPARVYLRHHLAAGYTLVAAPATFTTIGEDRLFEVELPPHGSTTVTIAEATPVERTLELQSEVALGMMKLYVEDPEATPALRAQLAVVLGTHRTGAEIADRIETLREQIGEYRARAAELDKQLVSLRGMRSSTELAASLRAKAGEIAEHIQKTTLAVVNAQEQLMMTRVKLANQLADLRLTEVAKSDVSSR